MRGSDQERKRGLQDLIDQARRVAAAMRQMQPAAGSRADPVALADSLEKCADEVEAAFRAFAGSASATLAVDELNASNDE